jgi:hypothetical protein
MNFVYLTLIGKIRASRRRSDSGAQAVRPTRACTAFARALPTLAALALGLAAEAGAAPIVHCVGTVQELRNAVAATNNSASAFDIRIRSGYYPFTADGTHTHALRFVRESYDVGLASRGFRISGAWNAGCTQQAQVIDAQNSTVLDGQDVIGVIDFVGWASTITRTLDSTVRLDRLQIARGRSPHADPLVRASGCFAYRRSGNNSNPVLQARFAFEIDRVRFELCEHAGLSLQSHYGAVVRNSFFLGNTGDRASAMNLSSDLGTASIYNNTLRNNVLTGTTNAATVVLLGSPWKYFMNNLIAENAHPPGTFVKDVLTNNTAVVRNNRLVNVEGDLGSTPIVFNNTVAAPEFLNAWNARLASSSPMRDLGHTEAPFPGVGDRDYDGNARVQGAAVDIGAHELAPLPQGAVFKSGFE